MKCRSHKLGTGLTAAVTAAAIAFAPIAAHAQDPQAPPPQQPPPGGYTAPIYQQTQPTYVPQSVAMSGPRIIKDYQEGDPIPPGYHVSHRLRGGLVGGGAGLFGAFWVFSALGAAIAHDVGSKSDNADALYIPAIGPFLQMTKTSTATGNFWNVFDGVAQCAGLAMLIYGITTPKTVLVRDDLGKVKVFPTPYATRGGGGLGLVGTF